MQTPSVPIKLYYLVSQVQKKNVWVLCCGPLTEAGQP